MKRVSDLSRLARGGRKWMRNRSLYRNDHARERLAATIVLALVWATSASATPEYILPTLFNVTDVAADDVLNIRAKPSAGAEIIGTLPSDARNVEVVAHDDSGQWAQVNTNERSGWVALRYLAYRTDVWQPGELPDTLRCLGTEPFWSLAPKGDAVALSMPDQPDQSMTLVAVLDPGAFRSPRRVIVAGSDAQSLTSVVVPSFCSDGMSDKAYGLDATLILRADNEARMLTGCCSIAPLPQARNCSRGWQNTVHPM